MNQKYGEHKPDKRWKLAVLKYKTALFQYSLFLSQSVQICIPRLHSYDIHSTIKNFFNFIFKILFV